MPCTTASGDGVTACAGNASSVSDARGTCTLPVTSMTGRRDVDREIRRREDLGVRQLHDADRVAAQRELRGPAGVRVEHASCPRASARRRRRGPSRRDRASGRRCSSPWLRCARRRAPSAARRCGRSTRRRGRRRSARRRCRRRRGRRRARPRLRSSSGDSSVRKPTSGHSTRTVPSTRESRARTSAIWPSTSALPPLVLRTAAVSSSRAVRQRHAGLHEVELRRERLLVAERDARARGAACQRDRAARVAHEIEQRARQLIDARELERGRQQRAAAVARSKFCPDTTRLSSGRPCRSSSRAPARVRDVHQAAVRERHEAAADGERRRRLEPPRAQDAARRCRAGRACRARRRRGRRPLPRPCARSSSAPPSMRAVCAAAVPFAASRRARDAQRAARDVPRLRPSARRARRPRARRRRGRRAARRATPANAASRSATRPLPRGSCHVPPSVTVRRQRAVDVGDEQVELVELRVDGEVERRRRRARPSARRGSYPESRRSASSRTRSRPVNAAAPPSVTG